MASPHECPGTHEEIYDFELFRIRNFISYLFSSFKGNLDQHFVPNVSLFLMKISATQHH